MNQNTQEARIYRFYKGPVFVPQIFTSCLCMYMQNLKLKYIPFILPRDRCLVRTWCFCQNRLQNFLEDANHRGREHTCLITNKQLEQR